jgi:hypothetical protein
VTDLPQHTAVAALAEKTDLEVIGDPKPISGGANNRVYVIQTVKKPIVLKEYFRHPLDPRDRLTAEFAFLSYAVSIGIDAVPRPLAADHETGLGLYEFIDGRQLEPEEVDDRAVDMAIDFLVSLDRGRDSSLAQSLANASEARFSIAGHLTLVRNRIERLLEIEVTEEIDAKAIQFVRDKLASRWQSVEKRILQIAHERTICSEDVIPADERIISPSDFGFHNALVRPDGRIAFIDFEYAGWDDPAKTVGDFFNQVKRPVPSTSFRRFCDALSPRSTNRIDLLLPVYRIKWCTILLNEFLPGASTRRQFAVGDRDIAAIKTLQLDKAQTAYQQWDS